MTNPINAKQFILDAIRQWPNEISLDDAAEQMFLLRKILRGLSDCEAGRVVSQEEMERMFGVDRDAMS